MKIFHAALCLLVFGSLKSYSAERILNEGLERNDLYQELLKEEFVDELKFWVKDMVSKVQQDASNKDEHLSNLHIQAQSIFSKMIRSCEGQEIGAKRKEISNMSSIFSSISAQAGEMHNIMLYPETYHLEWMRKMPVQKINWALILLLGESDAQDVLFEE